MLNLIGGVVAMVMSTWLRGCALYGKLKCARPWPGARPPRGAKIG
jgi:hypothetical protein